MACEKSDVDAIDELDEVNAAEEDDEDEKIDGSESGEFPGVTAMSKAKV